MLSGKNVVITGASRGIGKAIAMKMAQNGANIAVLCNSSIEQINEACVEIKEYGVDAKGYLVDVSNFEKTIEISKQVLADFGFIDVIVNNAGITRDALMLMMKEDDFDKVIDVNLKGPFNVVKSFIRPMLKKKTGAIVNITSISGMMGNAGQSNYSASKAGLIGLTKTWAKEFSAKGVRCNAVAPGFIMTDMTEDIVDKHGEDLLKQIPLKRLGKPDDVAELVNFLASDKASYITGEIIKVDGGIYV